MKLPAITTEEIQAVREAVGKVLSHATSISGAMMRTEIELPPVDGWRQCKAGDHIMVSLIVTVGEGKS